MSMEGCIIVVGIHTHLVYATAQSISSPPKINTFTNTWYYACTTLTMSITKAWNKP